jgi:two-component system, OmpR family, response regulator
MGAAALVAPPPPASLQRILVVEDDPDTQVIVSFALSRGGLTSEICGNGADALQKAATFQPQLILLDVMLPAMDGPTVFGELRRNPGLAAIPVVFMTARALPEEVAAFRALGPLDVIVKPFDPMTLAESLSTLWLRGRRASGGGETVRLRELEDSYVLTLPMRVEEIDRAARRYARAQAVAVEDVYRLAHRLAGSSAILGFAEVSEAAREVEDLALGLQRRRRRASERERRALSSAVKELRHASAAVSAGGPRPLSRDV